MRYVYNRQVSPPAPYRHGVIDRIDGGARSSFIPALVDSGADRTVIPMAAVEDLGLLRAGTIAATLANHSDIRSNRETGNG
jgi:predicted aspartyl protease